MNVSNNIAAMNAAAFSFETSAHNVANLSTEGYKTIEVTKSSGRAGPTVSTKRSDSAPDIATEMVKQMRETYDFKANAKVITFHDEMVGTAINMLA
jgi:flagellar hook protein FlgE